MPISYAKFPMSQLFEYIYRWCFAKRKETNTEEESEEETGTLLDQPPVENDWNLDSVLSLFDKGAPK